MVALANVAPDSALERIGRLVDLDQFQRAASVFEKWLADTAAEFRPPNGSHGGPTIEIDRMLTRHGWNDLPLLEDVLQELLAAWRDDDCDPARIRDAKIVAPVDGEKRERLKDRRFPQLKRNRSSGSLLGLFGDTPGANSGQVRPTTAARINSVHLERD